VLFAVLAAFTPVAALDNGLGLRAPAMGWSSWSAQSVLSATASSSKQFWRLHLTLSGLHERPAASSEIPLHAHRRRNHFKCGVSDALIRETADKMVSSGLRDAGYRYGVRSLALHFLPAGLR
jgi:hypothetical protein